MLSSLGDYFERKFSIVPSDAASSEFLQLLVDVVRSPSLMVSIPVLVTWTRILGHRTLGHSHLVNPMIGQLLEVCSSRLVRYENLPADAVDPTYLFLVEDTDTMPERHAFLGNYRRYCCQIVEMVVQLKVVDAISHVLRTTEQVLEHLYDGQAPFSSKESTSISGIVIIHADISEQNYRKHSLPVLRVDSQFTLVEAALKGFVKWRRLRQGNQVGWGYSHG